MNKVTQIQVSGLSGVFPAFAWTDRLYSENRVIKDGLHEEKWFTEDKIKIVGSDFYDNRLIQSISYNKYKLWIQAKESANIGLIELAASVIITLKDGEIHHAKVLSVDVSDVQNTPNKLYIISYYDFNIENYHYKQPVNEYMKRAVLQERYTQFQVTHLQIIQTGDYFADLIPFGNNYQLWTNIGHVKYTTKPEVTSAKVDGVEVPSRSVSQDVYRLLFYTNETDAKILEKYGPRVDGFDIRGHIYVYGVGDSESTGPLKVEISQVNNAVDLWKCQVEVPVLTENHYHFNN
jgi:hypothetical protein